MSATDIAAETIVVIPRLSDSMEEGTILAWHKESGATVAREEELCEIETDKATMPYESHLDGLLTIVAPAGSTLPIGAVIAYIGAAPAAGAVAAGSQQGRLRASPVARRIARELSIDLDALSGSGPDGRVVKADVLARSPAASPPPAPAPHPPTASPSTFPATPPTDAIKGQLTRLAPSKRQQVVTGRMAEAKATAPDFTLTMPVRMRAAAELRDRLKAAVTNERPTPSFNDLVVKAVALALRHPKANGAYRDGAFEFHERVNVGVAVAAPDTLVVPTVFTPTARASAASRPRRVRLRIAAAPAP